MKNDKTKNLITILLCIYLFKKKLKNIGVRFLSNFFRKTSTDNLTLNASLIKLKDITS